MALSTRSGFQTTKLATRLTNDIYMHGKHSWRVEGSPNQDVVISQLLSREVVEYIRNRKPNQNRGVAFSFWYKPDDALSNGEKNKAYAEIVYMVVPLDPNVHDISLAIL